MGANYYWLKDACEKCGRGEEVHIGKSSGGWCFGLRVYPERDINTLNDWEHKLSGETITNEYGDKLNLAELLLVLQARSWRARDYTPAFLRDNLATLGPNGLLCAATRHGISHGEGTWDYIPHEFS